MPRTDRKSISQSIDFGCTVQLSTALPYRTSLHREMASSMYLCVLTVALVFVCAAHGLESYFETENSESHECSLGEDNRLPYPYALHGQPPPLGDKCGDCGFVIVEKRHHYCIPGKSVIKVLRRKPTCNCKTPTGPRDFYGAESKVVPSYVSSGGSQGPSPVAEAMSSSDQVSRMLRTLISDRAGYGTGDSEKAATPQYRTLDENSASRTYN
uniref:Uncharacterized protein n=1 Tax=Anopheles atroparvus TaxID=41427 RepID=A0A182IJX4_ANOAO